MTALRQLVKIALTAITAALLSVIPASGAWAMLPVPDPGSAGAGASGAATVARTADSPGFASWQVVTVGAICALIAVLATVIATRFAQSNPQHPRLADA